MLTKPSTNVTAPIVFVQSQQRPEEEPTKDKSSIRDWTPPGDLAETGAWKVLRELAMTLSKSVSCTLKLWFGQRMLCYAAYPTGPSASAAELQIALSRSNYQLCMQHFADVRSCLRAAIPQGLHTCARSSSNAADVN